MTMTTGATKSVEALMDGLAVLHDARDALAGLLEKTAGAIAESVAGDPRLKRAEDSLRRALELVNPTDRDAFICRAAQEIEQLRRSRGGETHLLQLRQALLGYDDRLARQIGAVEELIAVATAARKRATEHFSVDEAAKPESVSRWAWRNLFRRRDRNHEAVSIQGGGRGPGGH